MWRGRDWKSSLPKPENNSEENKTFEEVDAISVASTLEGNELAASDTHLLSVKDVSPVTSDTIVSFVGSEDVHAEPHEDMSPVDDGESRSATVSVSTVMATNETTTDNSNAGFSHDEINGTKNVGNVTELDSSGFDNEVILNNKGFVDEEPATTSMGSKTMLGGGESPGNQSESFFAGSLNELQNLSDVSQDDKEPARFCSPSMESVLLLMKQAVESGSALILDDKTLDADIIYEKSVAFAKSAPPGPVFMHRSRKRATPKSEKKEKNEKKEAGNLEVKREVATIAEKRRNARQTRNRLENIDEHCLHVAPQGSLGVDDLAKLLA